MLSYFEYNGRRSTEFGISIFNDLSFSPAESDISEVEVLGRDGNLLIDNDRLKTIVKTIKFTVSVDKDSIESSSDGKPIFEKVLEIVDWLGVKGYHDFKWSMYPDYTYKATVIDPYSITDTIRQRGKGVIKVRFFPIMYLDSGLEEKTVTNGMIINNTGNVKALPVIRITPNGTQERIDILNNGLVWISLKDIENEITIDSELMQAYSDSENANNKMIIRSPLFPQLEYGENEISFDETQISNFTIQTKIGRKAI